MAKSATDVMHEIIFSAVIDSIMSLKAASKGLPNTLLRDLNAIHLNTTFPDMPRELQATISASVRAAFTRLLKEGYSVSSGQVGSPRNSLPRRETTGRPPQATKPPEKRGGAPDRKSPHNDGRSKRKPNPRGA